MAEELEDREKLNIFLKKNSNSNTYSEHRIKCSSPLDKQQSEFETERCHITEQSLSSL